MRAAQRLCAHTTARRGGERWPPPDSCGPRRARRPPALRRRSGLWSLAAAARVGDHLRAGLPREPVRGGTRLTRVEDVQPAAATAELDDLAVKRADEVDVVGLEVAEDHRQHAVAGEAERHAPHEAALAEADLAEHEHRRSRDQPRPLKPRDRVGAQRGAREQIASQRNADHRRASVRRERPQPADLHGRATPLVGGLHVR